VTQQQLDQFRKETTREIVMPDGTKRAVRMTPDLWNSLEFLEAWEFMSQSEIADYALEEMQLQNESFDRAFRGVVAYVSNLWAKQSYCP